MKKIMLIAIISMIVFTGCMDKENVDTSNDILVESNINNDSKKNNIIEKDEEDNMKIIENEYDTFYLSNNGDVYAKGLNECGELGLGHNKKVEEKTKIEGLKDITKIILGQNESRVFAYFIDKNGEVYASGYNADGQLALGHTNNVLVPTKISNISNVKDIETSQYLDCNTYFLTNEGQVYVSGANRQGELGVGHNNKVLIPTRVLTGIKAKQVVYGDMFGYTMYLSEEGEVYVSGYNVHPESTKDVYQINYCEKVGDLEGIKIVEINADDLVEHICVADNGEKYIIDNRGNGPVAMKISEFAVVDNENMKIWDTLSNIILYKGYEINAEPGYEFVSDMELDYKSSEKYNITYHNYKNGKYKGAKKGNLVETYEGCGVVEGVSKIAMSKKLNAVPRSYIKLETIPEELNEFLDCAYLEVHSIDLDGDEKQEYLLSYAWDYKAGDTEDGEPIASSYIMLLDHEYNKIADLASLKNGFWAGRKEEEYKRFLSLDNIEYIDIDEDGILEVMVEIPSYEGFGISILKYNNGIIEGETEIQASLLP